jgi:pyruvate/2-oxoglutarate dehydrogenase complex dihydrolipoamide dehydrogenase (E3) component
MGEPKNQATSGAELIMSNARFVAQRSVEIEVRDRGRRSISGDRVFLDLGSRVAMPQIPGLRAAEPMTQVEALDLDRLPEHLIVLGGGYMGLELSQAMRRLGSNVTVIRRGSAARQPRRSGHWHRPERFVR